MNAALDDGVDDDADDEEDDNARHDLAVAVEARPAHFHAPSARGGHAPSARGMFRPASLPLLLLVAPSGELVWASLPTPLSGVLRPPGLPHLPRLPNLGERLPHAPILTQRRSE